MRIVLLVLLLSVITFSGFAQKQISIPLYKNGDTVLWYKWQYELEAKLKLPHLAKDTTRFYFRFHNAGQVLDLYSHDLKTFKGTVTCYTYAYELYDTKKQTQKTSALFSQQVKLDSSIARRIFQLTGTVSTIPTDDSIKGWRQGLDGVTYMFEHSSPASYSFKSYWTPSAQDSTLMEAKLIRLFVDTIYKLVVTKAENDFFATLKPGSYTADNFIITYKPTEKQKARWKKYKPYRDYLNSVNDTLNRYLSDTLTQLLNAKGELLPEYTDYVLTFSPRNKLKKIKPKGGYLDLADWRDVHKGKRKLRKAFRKIRVNFVHSKVRYRKVVSGDKKKVTVEQ